MTDENGKDSMHKIGEDIVKSFHEQFAQNQNHHQGLFIQTLAILLTVLVGYGYIYVRVDSSESNLNVSIDTLYAYLVIAMFLLSISIGLISNMALGFRRDQLMASNIRIKAGVMTLGSNDNYFFGSFNPQGKTQFLFWMPEFHKIFFIGLYVSKVLLIMITLNFPGYELGLDVLNYSLYSHISILSLFVDMLVARFFWKKWVKNSDLAPARLKGAQ